VSNREHGEGGGRTEVVARKKESLPEGSPSPGIISGEGGGTASGNRVRKPHFPKSAYAEHDRKEGPRGSQPKGLKIAVGGGRRSLTPCKTVVDRKEIYQPKGLIPQNYQERSQ